MKDDFDIYLNRTGLSEGGYSNDPNDPGGETKFGISKRSYPELDIRNLTWEQASEIYYKDFWIGPRINLIPAPIVGSVFDFGVNSHPSVAISYLQRQLGSLADDGILGPVTLARINDWFRDMKNPETYLQAQLFTAKYNANRLVFMTKLKNWQHASGGWAIRVATRILEL